MTWKRYQRFLIVFLAYFLTAKGCQYLFYTFHTSPAVLWAPVGISFGFLFIWGLDQWIPIAVAQLLVSLISPSTPQLTAVLVSVFAYTSQAVLGTYVLKKLGFNGSMARTRDAIALIGVAIVFPAIAPALITLNAFLTHTLFISVWLNWSRSWGGGVLSILILTPLITSWLSDSRPSLSELRSVEGSLAMATVFTITYILFWTTLPVENAFALIYVFLGVFFWIGLRLQPRMMTLGLSIATVFGIMGTILAQPTTTVLSAQLFSDELFMILITPIFLILAVTVTERRVAVANFEREAEELADAIDRVSLQDKAKNEFISMLAHELRNPLAPIASTLEYLRLNEFDPENLKAVEIAEQQMKIMRRLLDDLLDVARITEKKFKLQKETTTLEAVARPAIAAVAPFFKSQDHSFSSSLPKETLFMSVDPARITQAIMNLLFNAGKYTPPGGTIELVAKRDADDMVSITIKDNGMGISAEALPLIFEPFQQAPREAYVGTGLGLGLFITKQLVEMHGGALTAKSAGANKGTTLLIRLPLVPYTEKAPALPPEKPMRSVKKARTFKILVVDDNDAAARALKRLLALRGHTVNIVNDGESVLKAIGKFKPEVVILDIGLPGMNGYEVAEEIRKRGMTLPLIALTGYGQEQDRIKAQKAGFDQHLTKPIGLADIEKVLSAF